MYDLEHNEVVHARVEEDKAFGRFVVTIPH